MEARAKFLASAARHYATSSPSTSAHLMLHRMELEDITSKPKRKDDPTPYCRACGTILVPGWTSRKVMISTRQSKKPRPTSDRKTHDSSAKDAPLESTMEEECMACRRVIRTPVPRKPRLQPVKGLRQGSSTDMRAGLDAGALQSAQGRNRKRRLKALLVKSKEEEAARAASTPNLDLMDLMRAT